eukprot:TRINITY_DN22836_c0_g1_i1.p1 TRINITY_DN22836_c0_g1~~TRINITY_DN22836_c0_g1_i1.p1  ORF type:complete len:427 (-),score=76.24 TRINITY_DN22836_c0_g1_i1:115-1395(-)
MEPCELSGTRQLQKLVAESRVELAELREECCVIQECLVAAGVLSQDTLLARIHRRRFEAVRFASRDAFTASFGSVLVGSSGLLELAACFAGEEAACAWAAAARSCVGIARALPRESEARLYMCGGIDGNGCVSCVESLDPRVGAWEEAPSMLQCRGNAAAAMFAGSIFVCGGFDGQQVLSSVERFDPGARAWMQAPQLMQARRNAVLAAFAGRLLLCGGSGSDSAMSSVECLEATPSAVWRPSRPMSQRRVSAGAATCAGRLYVCGGVCEDQPLRSVERLSPSSGAVWHCAPPMTQRRFQAATASVGGRVLFVVGGVDIHRGTSLEALTSVEMFNPEGAAWESMRSMPVPLVGGRAASIAGRLFVCGGASMIGFPRQWNGVVESYWPAAPNEFFRFDPASGRWTSMPRLRRHLSHAALTVFSVSVP